MIKRYSWILIISFLFAGSLFAAQDTTVIDDNAPVHTEPKVGSEIIEYLPMGLEIRVSTYPVPGGPGSGGWYKVRSKTGVYGWVEEKYLSTNKVSQKSEEGPVIVKPERDRKFFIRVLGGFSFFRPEELNDVFGFSELNTGYTVGTELGFFLAERFAVSFRSEIVAKDVVAKEANTGLTFNMGIRSYPITGGFDFFFAKLPALRLSLGLFAGVALSTTFTAEAMSLSQPNTVVLDSSPFTGYARVNLTRPLGRILSIFIEGGYRYLKTTEITTLNASNGGAVFIKDGVYRARSINLSGPVVALGLGIHF